MSEHVPLSAVLPNTAKDASSADADVWTSGTLEKAGFQVESTATTVSPARSSSKSSSLPGSCRNNSFSSVVGG